MPTLFSLNSTLFGFGIPTITGFHTHTYPLTDSKHKNKSHPKFATTATPVAKLNQAKPIPMSTPKQFDQNVIVMRHGDRLDNFDPNWVTTTDRPWDPPLVDQGLSRAFEVGRNFRSQIGFPIHRVFVSPFLRCVQTASNVVSALCSSPDVDVEPANVKVSIEYGLCEMLSREAIKPEIAPKDGYFRFNLPELESVLPPGTVDHSVEMIYKEMPRWEETVMGARSRYEHIIQTLADKYPSENILLVTHGEGVGVSVSTFLKKEATIYEVNYCAYSHARRHITFGNDDSFCAESFQLLTGPNQTGIGYLISNSLSDGV